MRKTYIENFIKHRGLYIVAVIAVVFSSIPFPATELVGDMNGNTIIYLLQKVSFWLGTGIFTWGILEALLVRRRRFN